MRAVHRWLQGHFILAVIALIGAAAYLGGCWTTHLEEELTRAEAGGVEQVSQVRRLLRAACGRLKAVNEGAANRATQMAEAGSDTASALERWNGFLEGCAGRASQAYASHPHWLAATAEISDGIAEMLKQVEQDNSDMAFKACGAACGKFVTLNELAGVRRTSDVLFLFRKAAKPLAQSVGKNDLEAIRPVLGTLLQLRDRALTDPVGGTGSPAQKGEALKVFSEAVSAFATAARADDQERLAARYGKMMSAMEAAYDLYL